MALSTGENEKRQIASILKKRLIEGKNTITYRELLDQEMPLFLKNFLQNRVKKLYVTDEPIQFKNSKRYDYNYGRIKELQAELRVAFEEATLFSKEEINDIIQRTVGLQFDLLVNPRNTLATIFYKNKSERTQTEILQILSGLSDKRLFIQKLVENLKEFDQYHILRDDFDKLVEQTQNTLFSENFLPAFISDVIAYAEFISQIRDREVHMIHKEILQLILTNRSYDNLCPAFNDVRPDDQFDIDELAAILSNYMDSNGNNGNNHYDDIEDDIEQFIVPAIETQTEEYEQDQDSDWEDEQPQNGADNYDVDETYDERPVFEDDVEYKPETEPEPEIESAKEPEPRRHFPIVEGWKDPQDIVIDRSQIESQPKGPLLSLQSIIDEKSKRLIQKKIFEKDEISFNNFIMRLEDVDNWKEAKHIIDEELLLRSVQPFSKEALTLGDLVFNRYFPKKK